jgi:hypothetical protein
MTNVNDYDYEDLQGLVDDLEACIEALEVERRWIPVSERLPKLGEFVLFYDSVAKRWCKGVLQRVGIEGKLQWNSTEHYTYHGDNFGHVTHWMIPQPPEVTG